VAPSATSGQQRGTSRAFSGRLVGARKRPALRGCRAQRAQSTSGCGQLATPRSDCGRPRHLSRRVRADSPPSHGPADQTRRRTAIQACLQRVGREMASTSTWPTRACQVCRARATRSRNARPFGLCDADSGRAAPAPPVGLRKRGGPAAARRSSRGARDARRSWASDAAQGEPRRRFLAAGPDALEAPELVADDEGAPPRACGAGSVEAPSRQAPTVRRRGPSKKPARPYILNDFLTFVTRCSNTRGSVGPETYSFRD